MSWISDLIEKLFGPTKGCHPKYKGKGNHPDFRNDRPVKGERFDHYWYLSRYPDVKGSKCYHDKPYAHYKKYGASEGRRRFPKPPKPTPPPPEPPPSTKPEVLLKISGKSFFSLCRLKSGALLAGEYCWPSPSAKIREVGGNTVASLTCGESIFGMFQDPNGSIYVSTEDRGYIYKAAPETYAFKKIHTMKKYGTLGGCFGINRVLGRIVVAGPEIWVEGLGVAKRIGKDYYCKSPFEFKGRAYIVGFSRKTKRAGYFVSKDCVSWKWKDALNECRFISAATDGDKAFIVGTNHYDGKHHPSSATCWETTDMLKFKKILGPVKEYDYASSIEMHSSGLYVGLNRGWRSHVPGCKLLFSPSGASRWKELAMFGESELRDILVDDAVYVATRTDQGGGAIYRIPIENNPPINKKMIGNFRGFEDNGQVIFRWRVPGASLPVCTLNWFEDKTRVKRSKKIDPSKQIGRHKGRDLYVNPSSRSRTPEWRGNLVIGLPPQAKPAYRGFKKWQEREDGAWLEW